MKKLVSILLAVLLAAGLFVPAMAAPGDPNTPIVKWVHSNQTLSTNRMPRDSTLELEITAALPEGSEGELSIEWFIGETIVGTAPRLDLKIEDWMIEESWSPIARGGTALSPNINVRLVVTNTYNDENGGEQKATYDREIRFFIEPKWLPKVLPYLALPVVFPLAFIAHIIFDYGMALPLLPLKLLSLFTGIFN